MERIHAPELEGALAWLNVDRPLSLAELRGQLVVLDFWTYCCINCMHVLPTLRAMEERFATEPLVVIGVHSAKFDEESNPRRIAEAIARYEIAHPVAVDSGMQIWRRYGVRSWPTLVIIRPDGTLAAVAPGEPDAATLGQFLQRQLDEARAAGTLAAQPFHPPHTVTDGGGPLKFPGKVAVAPDGRLAISDSGHHRVLVCGPDGAVQAVAGSGLRGLADGALAEAAFDDPEGVAWRDGRVIVCDVRNHALREIDLEAGRVTTLAGTGELGGRLPRGPQPGREVALRSPWDVAISSEGGELAYVAMAGSHQLWRYDFGDGTIGPLAGSGAEALVDGPFAEAAFAQPSGLWLDRARQHLYVADSETSSVRKVDLEKRQVSTVIGEGLFDFGDVDGPLARARLQHDLGICGRELDGKLALFIADTYNSKLKRIDLDGARIDALPVGELLEPAGLCFAPDGRLFVCDTNHHRVLVLDRNLEKAEELPIRGAPSPLSGVAQAAGSAPPPATSGADGWFTAQLTLPDGAALGAGEGALALTLVAPAGHEIAAGSPLHLRIEVSRRPDLLAIDEERHLEAAGGPQLTVEIPARVGSLKGEPIESELIATIDLVACDKGDRAVCTPVRAHVRIPVRLAAGGTRTLAFEVPLPRP